MAGAPQPRTAHLVVADDEAALRDSIARYLRARGYDVTTAATGKEAMMALEATGADVVITDINMPDMDGIEIINALREFERAIPVIAMSGGGLLDKQLLLDSAKMLGAVVTLEKPFELAELHVAVARVLLDR